MKIRNKIETLERTRTQILSKNLLSFNQVSQEALLFRCEFRLWIEYLYPVFFTIMLLEMRALYRGIIALNLHSIPIRVLTDSTAVYFYLRALGGSGSLELLRETHRLLEVCDRRNIMIMDVLWVASKDNLRADALSRAPSLNALKNHLFNNTEEYGIHSLVSVAKRL